MDNGTGQWRSWEHEGGFQKDFHHGQPGGFPPHMGPGGPGAKMHGNFYNGGGNNFMMQQDFNNRMVNFTNFLLKTYFSESWRAFCSSASRSSTT
jgi:hypothetical protein